MLQLGLAPKDNLLKRKFPHTFFVEGDVGMIAETVGYAGAGYLVNEQHESAGKIIVHRRGPLTFAIAKPGTLRREPRRLARIRGDETEGHR